MADIANDEKIIYTLGKLDATTAEIRERVVRIEANQDLLRASVEEHGRRIVALPCDLRRRQIAGLARAVSRQSDSANKLELQLVEQQAVGKAISGAAQAVWAARGWWVPAVAAAAAAAAAWLSSRLPL